MHIVLMFMFNKLMVLAFSCHFSSWKDFDSQVLSQSLNTALASKTSQELKLNNIKDVMK